MSLPCVREEFLLACCARSVALATDRVALKATIHRVYTTTTFRLAASWRSKARRVVCSIVIDAPTSPWFAERKSAHQIRKTPMTRRLCRGAVVGSRPVAPDACRARRGIEGNGNLCPNFASLRRGGSINREPAEGSFLYHRMRQRDGGCGWETDSNGFDGRTAVRRGDGAG
jgi:hypothetical protein